MPIDEIIAACAALSDEDMAKLREALGVTASDEESAKKQAEEEAAKRSADEAAAKLAADEAEAAKKAADEAAKESENQSGGLSASDVIEEIEAREDLIEMAKDSGIELSRKGLKTVEDVAKAIAKQEGLTACDSATVKGYLLGKQKASTIMVADAATVVEPVSIRSFYKKG